MKRTEKMEIEVLREISMENVKHNNIYEVETINGKRGAVKAEVKDEWTEVHPRQVYFLALDNDLLAGEPVTRIFEVSE